MSHVTLLLNSSYEPLKVISWQRAVSLWAADKVEILEEYDDFDLRSVTFTMKCPAVVRLVSYFKRHKSDVKFSRLNVFGRDNFQCQFCGQQPGVRNLTFDHVIPRSRGGKTTWENIVTACLTCNSKKSNRTPEEAKMRLLSTPKKPAKKPFNKWTFNLPKTPDSWRSYLYWSATLDTDD